MNGRRLQRAAGLAALLLALAVGPLFARLQLPMPQLCPPCEGIANTFVRADIGLAGTWVLGTTGGDPDTTLDDDTSLLYGFKPGGLSTVGSSFTTIRVSGPAGTFDRVPPAAVNQIVRFNQVATVWTGPAPYSVVVTETLQLAHNRFSGRPDAAEVCYEATNRDRVPLAVGLRALLDVKLGENDGAPYFVPGVGAVNREAEFLGGAVPAFWVAFESPTYDPSMLRTVGILRGGNVVPPDRFVIADWVRIQNMDWDYQIRPTAPVTQDSAVALFWNPRTLAPGEQLALCSQYGLTSTRGGSAFLTAPREAQCDTDITVALFVNNFGTTPLTGGQATVQLPPGLALGPGEVATKAVATIAPGATGSVQWQVAIPQGAQGDFVLAASATFDGGKRFDATSSLKVSCPVPPTPTPTHTSTPPPTATVITGPTTVPTEGPGRPHVCDFVLNRVPTAAISRALANPQLVRGWGELANPSAPPSPYNQLRRWLSLYNISAPFHPLHNTLVFKAGCP